MTVHDEDGYVAQNVTGEPYGVLKGTTDVGFSAPEATTVSYRYGFSVEGATERVVYVGSASTEQQAARAARQHANGRREALRALSMPNKVTPWLQQVVFTHNVTIHAHYEINDAEKKAF